jgi:hypothetical protein
VNNFPTHVSTYGFGGWHEVTDVTARNNIALRRKKAGMIAYTRADSSFYQLRNDTASWRQLYIPLSITSPLSMSAAGALSIGNIPVTNLNSGTGASATTFWRGDATWGTPAGTTYTGTANQVIVTGTVLSTPQNIHTGASPTFVDVSHNAGGKMKLFPATNPSGMYSYTYSSAEEQSGAITEFVTNDGQVDLKIFGYAGGGFYIYEPAGTEKYTFSFPNTASNKTISFYDATATVAYNNAVYGGTGQTTYATGDLLYASATNTLSKLAIGAANTFLVGGTTPSYAAKWDTITKAIEYSGVAAVDSDYVFECPYGAATVVSIRAVRVGGTSASINIRKNGSSATALLSGDYATTTSMADAATLQNNTLVLNDMLKVHITAISGTVTKLFVQIRIRRQII